MARAGRPRCIRLILAGSAVGTRAPDASPGPAPRGTHRRITWSVARRAAARAQPGGCPAGLPYADQREGRAAGVRPRRGPAASDVISGRCSRRTRTRRSRVRCSATRSGRPRAPDPATPGVRQHRHPAYPAHGHDAARLRAEALIRLRGPDGEQVPPFSFIPVAEQTGQRSCAGFCADRPAPAD